MGDPVKKAIAADWAKAFPTLYPFTQKWFFKRVGPLIMGFNLQNQPHYSGAYRPYFDIFPLWRENLKACLKFPVIYHEFKKRNGLQFHIEYEKHSEFWEEVLECANNQLLFRLDGDLKFEEVIKGTDAYCRLPLTKLMGDKQRAYMLEFEFYVALYTGNKNYVEKIVSQIEEESRHWNIPKVEIWFGNFDKWFQSFQDKIMERDAFMARIDNNANHVKLKNLSVSDIIA